MYPYLILLGKKIPTYGLLLLVGLLIASFFACIHAKKKCLSIDDVIIIITLTFGFALISAKLFYIVLTFSFFEMLGLIRDGDYSFIVDSGGLFFYGGLIGGLIGLFLCQRVFKIPLLEYEQVLIPVIPLGHAIGRLGCFFAGCCYGVPYEGIGKITYPYGIVPSLDVSVSYFPVQLYESFFNLFIFIILLYAIKRRPKPYNTALLYLISYSCIRFFLEYYRNDEVRGGIIFGLSPSQWISLLIIIISLIIAVYRTFDKSLSKTHGYNPRKESNLEQK